MKAWFLLALLWARPLTLRAADVLAGLYGEDLTGRPFTMEARTPGQTVVVIVGFSKAAYKACQAFEDAFWKDFGGDTRVAIASVAELQGVPGLILPFIKDGMRKGAPPERYPWKWLSFRDRNGLQEAVGYEGGKAPDEAYIAFLEAKEHGTLLRNHAAYSPEAYASFKESLGLILDPPKPRPKKRKKKQSTL